MYPICGWRGVSVGVRGWENGPDRMRSPKGVRGGRIRCYLGHSEEGAEGRRGRVERFGSTGIAASRWSGGAGSNSDGEGGLGGSPCGYLEGGGVRGGGGEGAFASEQETLRGPWGLRRVILRRSRYIFEN